jgi:hypothetical protein
MSSLLDLNTSTCERSTHELPDGVAGQGKPSLRINRAVAGLSLQLLVYLGRDVLRVLALAPCLRRAVQRRASATYQYA